MDRNKLAQIAQDTLSIIEKGMYKVGSWEFDIKDSIEYSVKNSILYHPNDVITFYENMREKYNTTIEVTNESTLMAGRRLSDKKLKVCSLNFASAKNPGGGFLKGSSAQEESIARSSALYPCIKQMTEMYEYNRNKTSTLYSDYMIFSPLVPILKEDSGFLTRCYKNSFITSPAVNLSFDTFDNKIVQNIMLQRIDKILSVAAANNQEALVLGAFGCGVFKNDPEDVAQYFKTLLDGKFKGVFKHITFAIYDKNGNMVNIFKKHLIT
jgi:uncharacterized protein (TIGR02452 family)